MTWTFLTDYKGKPVLVRGRIRHNHRPCRKASEGHRALQGTCEAQRGAEGSSSVVDPVTYGYGPPAHIEGVAGVALPLDKGDLVSRRGCSRARPGHTYFVCITQPRRQCKVRLVSSIGERCNVRAHCVFVRRLSCDLAEPLWCPSK